MYWFKKRYPSLVVRFLNHPVIPLMIFSLWIFLVALILKV